MNDTTLLVIPFFFITCACQQSEDYVQSILYMVLEFFFWFFHTQRLQKMTIILLLYHTIYSHMPNHRHLIGCNMETLCHNCDEKLSTGCNTRYDQKDIGLLL